MQCKYNTICFYEHNVEPDNNNNKKNKINL